MQSVKTVMTETMERDEEILPSLGYLAAGVTAMLARLSRDVLAPFDIAPVRDRILMYLLKKSGEHDRSWWAQYTSTQPR